MKPIGQRVGAAAIGVQAILSLSACAPAIDVTPSASSAAATALPERELLEPREGLYAEAARADGLVWTAGHLPEGLPSTAPLAAQVRVVMAGLEQTLEEAGAGFDTVVKVNVFLTSFDDWEEFNTLYGLEMGRHGLPPRSTVAVSELGLGYRIEMEMVAVVREAADDSIGLRPAASRQPGG